jgi:anti-sigma regulatory factor (Ser/Thr protein kinase)
MTALTSPPQATAPLPVRTTRARLQPDDTAPSRARAIIRAALTQWGLERLTDYAEIIASEIIANAADASAAATRPPWTPAPITVHVSAQHDTLTIRVWDPLTTLPPPRPQLPADDAERGRGLIVIDALSDEWGSYRAPKDGKYVWARLDLTTTSSTTSPAEDTPMTASNARLAQLRQRHAARWDTWTVTCQARTWWCAKPAGTDAAVHEEDTPDALDTWIRRVDAITASGITIAFQHDGHDITATATWTSPGTRTPATYGPAPVPEVLDHAEDTRARRLGMIQWLTEDPEGTARHMADAQIRDLIPHVPDDSARRVLQAITSHRAAAQPAQPDAR